MLQLVHWIISRGRSFLQCLQSVASSLMISAQCGHFFISPRLSVGGNTNSAIRAGGNTKPANAHKNGLLPLACAPSAPIRAASMLSSSSLFTLLVAVYLGQDTVSPGA